MKTISRYIMTLALLITAVTGAWAQGAFSSDPYTSTTEFNSVSVTSSMTLNINEGVIVTVNSGLTIEDGVTLTLTGGGRLSVYGKTGDWGRDASYEEGNRIVEATAGGDGKPAIILNGNAKIVIDNGEIYAEGGQGGIGGKDATAGINQPDGAAGNAFSRFPTIDGATLYYKSSNEWIKYTSGDKTLYREMKAVPATLEVTLNDDKTEATMESMPTYDVNFSYELVRDMSVDVTATIDDRIRIKKDGNDYQPVGANGETDASAALPAVTDNLDAENPVNMTKETDYTLTLQKQGETEDSWTDVTAYSVGTFRYKVTGTGNYSGEIITKTFKLYEGYEVEVPAGEYITYYKDEALKVEDADAKLYTITAVDETAATATLSDAMTVTPANTPLLVYNSSEDTKTFLLIPTTDEANNVTAANEFKGTLEATQIAASTANQNNYAFNGKEFVWVKTALSVAANKAWLSISGPSNTRSISIVFDSETTGINGVSSTVETGDGNWYDLNGRKFTTKPTKKGVYIVNGKKVVIKN